MKKNTPERNTIETQNFSVVLERSVANKNKVIVWIHFYDHNGVSRAKMIQITEHRTQENHSRLVIDSSNETLMQHKQEVTK